jgi:hypothetical protein
MGIAFQAKGEKEGEGCSYDGRLATAKNYSFALLWGVMTWITLFERALAVGTPYVGNSSVVLLSGDGKGKHSSSTRWGQRKKETKNKDAANWDPSFTNTHPLCRVPVERFRGPCGGDCFWG